MSHIDYGAHDHVDDDARTPLMQTIVRGRDAPISSSKLLMAIILFSIATILAFLESVGGSTSSPARKNLAIASFNYSNTKVSRYIWLMEQICSLSVIEALYFNGWDLF